VLQSQDPVNMTVDVEFHRKEKFVDRRVSRHSQRAEVVQYIPALYICGYYDEGCLTFF